MTNDRKLRRTHAANRFQGGVCERDEKGVGLDVVPSDEATQVAAGTRLKHRPAQQASELMRRQRTSRHKSKTLYDHRRNTSLLSAHTTIADAETKQVRDEISPTINPPTSDYYTPSSVGYITMILTSNAVDSNVDFEVIRAKINRRVA